MLISISEATELRGICSMQHSLRHMASEMPDLMLSSHLKALPVLQNNFVDAAKAVTSEPNCHCQPVLEI